jgi:plasmid rolling circle replication initiator protein Rep
MKRALKSPLPLASKSGGFESNKINTQITSTDSLLKAIRDNTSSKKELNQLIDKLKLNNQGSRLPIKRLAECGNYLTFKDYYKIKKLKLTTANFCRCHLLCHRCAHYRALDNADDIRLIVEDIIKNRSNATFHFLTATVRNGKQLPECLSRLNRYKQIFMDRFRKQNVKTSITTKIQGGFWSTEITHNDKQNTWHPHIHMLVETNGDITTSQFRKEWKSISHGESFMCDAQKIDINTPEQLFKACLEISKYTLKNTQLTPELLAEAYVITKGKPYVGRFGTFRKNKLTIEPKLNNFENEPFWLYAFQWAKTKYQFVKDACNHYDNEEDFINQSTKKDINNEK